MGECWTADDVVELWDRAGGPKPGSDLLVGHVAGQPDVEDAHLEEEKGDISGHRAKSL
jgi:hypothetical protein